MSTSTSSIVFDDDGDLHPTFADFSASQIAELIYIAVRVREVVRVQNASNRVCT